MIKKKIMSGKDIFRAVIMVGTHAFWLFILFFYFSDISGSFTESFWTSFVRIVVIIWSIAGTFGLAYSFRKRSIHPVWKLSLVVELPIILLSILILLSESTSPPLLAVYIMAITSSIAFAAHTFLGKTWKEKYRNIFQSISFVATGLATYVFSVWSIVFVYVVFEMVEALFETSILEFALDGVWALPSAIFIFSLFFAPVYSIIEYGKWAFNMLSRFVNSDKNYVLQKKIGIIIGSYSLVFAILTSFNATLYRNNISDLLLESKEDYFSLYKDDNLEERIVNAYAMEKNYIEDVDCEATLSIENDNTREGFCKVLTPLSEFFLTPLRILGVSVSEKHSASELVSKLYENEIKESNVFDIEKYNLFAQEKNLRQTYIRGNNLIESVMMDELEDNITVDIKNGLAKHDLTMQFSSEESRNREIVFLLSVPSDTVIMDMNLGRKLELPRIISPRGAASSVYEKSKRKRVDPAVISKVGNGLYLVRVFPVYPTTDVNKMQKLQLVYSVSTSNEIVLPQISSLRNLVIDAKDSKIYGSISVSENSPNLKSSSTYVKSVDKNTIKWEVKNSSEITEYMPKIQIDLGTNIAPYCSRKHTSNTNAVVLFDVSYSAKDQEQKYKEIIKYISSRYTRVVYVGYSNEISSLDPDNIQFYGDNVPNVLEVFLRKQYHSGEDVYVVTDANSYTRYVPYKERHLDTFYNFRSVKGSYSIIFTEKPKLMPDEVTLVSSMTGGIVGNLDSLRRFDQKNESCSLSTLGRDDAINKANSSDNNLYDIFDADSFNKAGKRMWANAYQYSYVDSLNSFIALETKEQYRQLDEAAKKNNAFNNLDKVNINSGGMMSAPEPSGIYAWIQAVLLLLVGLVALKKKKDLNDLL